MSFNFIKYIALKCVSYDIKYPECLVDRYSELMHLKKLLDLKKINVVLDVGANEGQFSHELRMIGYKGYILSFEPVNKVFNILNESFKNDDKWIGFNFALGNENKETTINVSDVTLMSSLLESIGDSYIEKENISIKKLDDVLLNIIKDIPNPVVFLKMDTQGYDLEVFKGASGCLNLIQGIQSELSVQPLYKNMPHYNEVLIEYEKSNYELYNLSVVNRIRNGGLLELNAFMIK